MIDLNEEIKKYLPQYLSDTELCHLKDELARFPVDGTKDTIYTTALAGADFLLQGDGIREMEYLNFPDIKMGHVNAILLSNTCDMSIGNKRMNPCRIMYAPIVNFEKYANNLLGAFPEQRVNNHLKDIKAQLISQIMFLPKGGRLDYDGIVFFYRAIIIPLADVLFKNICANRLFTLSNFGLYLFLFKMSVHFTRIQERIDRTTGDDLGNNSAISNH